MTQMFKIRNDLIEAYKGYYEDDREALRLAKEHFKVDIITDAQFGEWIVYKILTDSHKERLERYLEWNGIQGYTNSIYEIAHGSISV